MTIEIIDRLESSEIRVKRDRDDERDPDATAYIEDAPFTTGQYTDIVRPRRKRD